MSRHVEVQIAPPFMGQHQEYVQDLEANCGHGKEIDGDKLADVILQKAAPRLGRWFPMTGHVLAYTGFADIDAQFKQFAMNARRTPEWVGTTHGTDQIPDFA